MVATRCGKAFNDMVEQFLRKRDIPTTVLAQQMDYAVGSSTIRNWTLGQPASQKTAQKFISGILAKFPDEDAEQWYSSC